MDSAVGAQQNDQLQLRRDHVRHRCLTLRHGGTLRGKLAKEYRVSHLFVDLGWVDLDFDCSTDTVYPNLLGNLTEQTGELSKMVEHPN